MILLTNYAGPGYQVSNPLPSCIARSYDDTAQEEHIDYIEKMPDKRSPDRHHTTILFDDFDTRNPFPERLPRQTFIKRHQAKIDRE